MNYDTVAEASLHTCKSIRFFRGSLREPGDVYKEMVDHVTNCLSSNE